MTKNLIILFLSIHSFANAQIAPNIGDPWKVGEAKVFFGIKVKRLEGDNMDQVYVTNVQYVSKSVSKQHAIKDAETEMWTEQKKNAVLKMYDDLTPGGTINIFIGRGDMESANQKFFTVIVQDTLKHELFREELPARVPNPPDLDRLWYSVANISIPKPLNRKVVDIYVIDAVMKAKYKFRVGN